VSQLLDPTIHTLIALRGHVGAIESRAYSTAAEAVVNGFQRPALSAVPTFLAAISPGGARYLEAERLLAELDG
jgi:hypothetical protein